MRYSLSLHPFRLMKHTLIIAFTLLLLLSVKSVIAEITFNKEYISPNGKFSTVLIQKSDGSSRLEIKDRKNKSVNSFFASGYLNIEWNKKSDAIVCVFHFAGGTGLEIYLLRNGKWVEAENNPYFNCEGDVDKGEDGKSFIYKYIISKNTVKAYFVFYVRKKSYTPASDVDITDRTGVDILTISLSTGEVIDASSRAIPDSEYRKLLDSAPWEK